MVDGVLFKLCYKTTTQYALAGLYTYDQYVLCESEASKKYWPMPDVAKLDALQKMGLIPSPLPKYHRPIIDYLIGYSLWPLIALVILLSYLGRSRSKSENQVAVSVLKAASRRVMARMVLIKPEATVHNANFARLVYQSLCREPLTEEEFASDLQWVRDEPIAFENYLGAIGRKLNRNGHFILLRSAAHVAVADGILDLNEEAAIRDIAEKLGLFREEADNFIENLREQLSKQPPPENAGQPA